VGRNLYASGQDVYINSVVPEPPGSGELDQAGPCGPDPRRLGVFGRQQARSGVWGSRAREAVLHARADARAQGRFPAARAVFWLLGLASALLTGVIVIALAPTLVTQTADRLAAQPWISLAIGAGVLLLTPAVILVLFCTIVGIPLATILLAMYLIMLYLAQLFLAVVLGRWVISGLGRADPSLYLSLLVGLVIVWLLGLIPVVGFVARSVRLPVRSGGTRTTTLRLDAAVASRRPHLTLDVGSPRCVIQRWPLRAPYIGAAQPLFGGTRCFLGKYGLAWRRVTGYASSPGPASVRRVASPLPRCRGSVGDAPPRRSGHCGSMGT